MRVTAPEVRASMLMDHAQVGAWGLRGGERGAVSAVTVRRRGSDAFVPFTEAFGTQSAAKFADVRLKEGDEVRIDSAGGAGWGDPAARDPGLVERDRREGFVPAQ
jgi:N-methylhydantoinase B/oxoprolinase/acetone carboxylase alpha subunit